MKKKNKWYRYVTKKFRNLKVSELVHLCQSCGCDECPLNHTCFCLVDLVNYDPKILQHTVRFRYVYKRYNFDDGEH